MDAIPSVIESGPGGGSGLKRDTDVANITGPSDDRRPRPRPSAGTRSATKAGRWALDARPAQGRVGEGPRHVAQHRIHTVFFRLGRPPPRTRSVSRRRAGQGREAGRAAGPDADLATSGPTSVCLSPRLANRHPELVRPPSARAAPGPGVLLAERSPCGMTIATLLFALIASPAAERDGRTVMLDFPASWCGPCQQNGPAVEQLVQKGYRIKSIDVDQSPDLAERYEVTGSRPSSWSTRGTADNSRTEGSQPASQTGPALSRGQGPV